MAVFGASVAAGGMVAGAATAFITTEGFRDVIEQGYEKRFDHYDLMIDRPVPLVPRTLRLEVRERLPEGTTLTMTRGSFTGTQAPAMSGGAIAAVLGPQSNLTLQSVDLDAVNNDLSVTSSSYSAQRNLGADADLTCSATACTP